MDGNRQWPIRHILIGVPIVLAVSAVLGGVLGNWSMAKATILAGAAMTSPVAMIYTFLVALAERSYIVVFWAMEKTRGWLAQARSEGAIQSDQKWRAWYERQQAAFHEGLPFDEPPPTPPENGQDSTSN